MRVGCCKRGVITWVGDSRCAQDVSSNFPGTLSSNLAPIANGKSQFRVAKLAYAVPCIPNIPSDEKWFHEKLLFPFKLLLEFYIFHRISTTTTIIQQISVFSALCLVVVLHVLQGAAVFWGGGVLCGGPKALTSYSRDDVVLRVIIQFNGVVICVSLGDKQESRKSAENPSPQGGILREGC